MVVCVELFKNLIESISNPPDWRRDLRACSEIMRTSLDMDAPLSEAHNQKLLNLLLGTTPAPRKRPAPRTPQPKFELQF